VEGGDAECAARRKAKSGSFDAFTSATLPSSLRVNSAGPLRLPSFLRASRVNRVTAIGTERREVWGAIRERGSLRWRSERGGWEEGVRGKPFEAPFVPQGKQGKHEK